MCPGDVCLFFHCYYRDLFTFRFEWNCWRGAVSHECRKACIGCDVRSFQTNKLDIRLQVEVKDQKMDKHALGIYHRISTQYADPVMNSVELCISYGEFPRVA